MIILGFDGSCIYLRSYRRFTFRFSKNFLLLVEKNPFQIISQFMENLWTRQKNRCIDRRIRCLSRDKIFREKLNAFLSPRRQKLEK